jgi:hypothetical protein
VDEKDVFEVPFECFNPEHPADQIRLKAAKKYKTKIMRLLKKSRVFVDRLVDDTDAAPDDAGNYPQKKVKTDELIGGKYYNISQVADALGVSRQLLYGYKLQKDPDIYSLLRQIRVARKIKLQHGMENSNNAGERLAAFRLLADDDERAMLNTRHEITGSDGGAIETETKHEHEHDHKLRVDDALAQALPEGTLQLLLKAYKSVPKPDEKAE